MSGDVMSMIQAAASLPLTERVPRLAEIGRVALADHNLAPAAREQLAASILEVVDAGAGDSKGRLEVGEILGQLGDPRLAVPSDAAYWVRVPSDDGEIVIGRYLVTNHEYLRWVDAGGYDQRSNWSDEGWAWKQGCTDPWPVRARAAGSEPFVVPNQPVVGVTWYEAEAYARAMGARLPNADERVRVIRGREKRPYPWGSPFGEGNANTREEVLGRPCAVGLFVRDRTPEGVADLAGNAGEWTADGVGGERLVHPGSWDEPSMAAWAKALEMVAPDDRSPSIGFRLARDAR